MTTARTSANAANAVRWPGTMVLAGVGTSLLALLYVAWRFPASVAGDGARPFVGSLLGLTAYAVVALWSRHAAARAWRTAFHIGGVAGLGLAAAAIGNHALELWTVLPPAVGAVLGAGMWGLMFLGFAAACTAALARHRSAAAGVLASVWSAIVMTTLLVAFALSAGLGALIATGRVLGAPCAAIATAATRDAGTCLASDLTRAAVPHLTLAPIIAAIVGVLAAGVVAAARRVPRSAARALAGATLVLLAGGAASLVHAASLRRSRRPPFVGLGLLAFAVSLASVVPLATRSRRRAP